jgi:hypothetical protein
MNFKLVTFADAASSAPGAGGCQGPPEDDGGRELAGGMAGSQSKLRTSVIKPDLLLQSRTLARAAVAAIHTMLHDSFGASPVLDVPGVGTYYELRRR